MDTVTFGYIRGFALLFWLNLRHYALALWGIRLRLDPDYPGETRFHGDLIVDAVLEYRGYALFAPWCALLALTMPQAVLIILAALWTVLAWKRAAYYRTAFNFWTRAYSEAPAKKRNQIRYAEELMKEIERREKAGAAWNSPELQKLISTARDIQERIVHDGLRTTGKT